MKRLKMRKIRDAMRLEAAGLSTHKIAASLGVGQSTASDYLSRARAAGLSWPLPADLADAELEGRLFPRSVQVRSATFPQPDWAHVHAELRRKGVTLALLWEEYRGIHIDGYPAATAEAWVDGHVHAFAFFGKVPASVLYDNDRCLVAKILPDGTRQRATLFSGFLSHYLFRDRYGRPGKGNDKGNVEGLVGYSRRNFMVPIPRFATWDAFNGYLEDQCRKRQADVLRGQSETIGQRLARDLVAMLQRNLLYTGITRGKRLVVIVGQRKAVAIAVKNVSGRRRWSKLGEWLGRSVVAAHHNTE
jgi:transposase